MGSYHKVFSRKISCKRYVKSNPGPSQVCAMQAHNLYQCKNTKTQPVSHSCNNRSIKIDKTDNSDNNIHSKNKKPEAFTSE